MRNVKRFVVVLALCALAGCGTAAGLDTKSPQMAVFGIKADYNALLAVAAKYNELPRCEIPAAPKVCSKQSVVELVRSTNTTASAALDSAENVVRTKGISDSTANLAVTAATESVSLMRKILLQYNLLRGA